MYPRFNLYSYYNQCNHLFAPKYFDWVKDVSGEINFFVDDYVPQKPNITSNKPNVAMLIEPRTIQPLVYEWLEQNYKEFDIIFSHDTKILQFANAYPIFFMNWYKTYNVPKTKNISMVCSDKVMCEEHAARQSIADILGDRVDHYGKYKGHYCDYYECRAEYMFEVVVDNNWEGYWLSEKLANPLASKTIPIYLGGQFFPSDLDLNGIIMVESVGDIPSIVDGILQNPDKVYYNRIKAVEHNYKAIQRYHVFEDWLFEEYHQLFEDLINKGV